jgi:ribokinase
VDGAGQNMIAVASGANHTLGAGDVTERLRDLAAEGVVLLANLEIPDGAILAAAEHAARSGWRFVLNPAPARPLPQGLLRLCDVLTPNETEAETLGSVEVLLGQGAGAVVVTLGAKGARVHRGDGSTVHQPSIAVDVVDTTGAGDAFNGALAWSLASGHDLEEAVRWATAAGALACRALGARASLPDREELERAVDASRAPGEGRP